MLWIIATPLLLGLALVCWRLSRRWYAHVAAAQGGPVDAYGRSPDTSTPATAALLARIAAPVIVVLWLLYTGLNIVWLVPAGHVGVVYTFSDIVGQVGSGAQAIAPWQDMKVATTRTQRRQFTHLATFSKETQDVFVDATLNYRVSEKAIQNLYRTVGPDWYEKLVPPRVRQTLKDETVKYLAVTIAPARESIRTSVKRRLADQLSTYSVDVEDFLLDNIDFRPEFKASIEEKQIATQKAQTEQNRVQAAEYRKQQAIKRAEGEAQSILVRATAQATANRKLSASLTPQLIAYQWITKIAPTVRTLLLPSGQSAILPPELFKTK